MIHVDLWGRSARGRAPPSNGTRRLRLAGGLSVTSALPSLGLFHRRSRSKRHLLHLTEPHRPRPHVRGPTVRGPADGARPGHTRGPEEAAWTQADTNPWMSTGKASTSPSPSHPAGPGMAGISARASLTVARPMEPPSSSTERPCRSMPTLVFGLRRNCTRADEHGQGISWPPWEPNRCGGRRHRLVRRANSEGAANGWAGMEIELTVPVGVDFANCNQRPIPKLGP